MPQQQTADTAAGRAHWLSNPIVIDRTKEYKNRVGEVVPFGVTKFCAKCNKNKDLWNDFYYRSSSSDLHQAWCKDCSKQSVRESQQKKAQEKQGSKLLKVPEKTTIHAGVGVRAPEVATVPVITRTEQSATPEPETVAMPTLVSTPVAEVPVAEKFEPAPAPIAAPAEEAAVAASQNGIVGVTALEESEARPRIQFNAASFIEFHDWLTSPNNGKSMFMTRGAEAIVTTRDDGKCWIATPNQSGPGQWIAPELASYILKLLTGENTDEAFYGMLYR